MKTAKIVLVLVLFIAVAGLVAALGGDKITKTSQIKLVLTNCAYGVTGELKVKKDQNVFMAVVSDRAGEFHIHGYDLKKELAANQTERFNFRAVQSGIFDLEQHGCPEENHVQLMVLNADGSQPSVEEHEEEVHDEDETETETHDE